MPEIILRKPFVTLVALVMVVLFAACQPAAPTPTNAPAELPPTPTPESVEASPLAVPDSGNPSIIVAGDLMAAVEADNFYVARVKADDETIIGTVLYFNQDDTRIVFIRFPKDAAPGTYPITSGYTDSFDGTSATANYFDQTTDPAGQFAATGGTLTLTETGDAFTGSYTFTAVGLDDTPQRGQTVTISGAFAGVES